MPLKRTPPTTPQQNPNQEAVNTGPLVTDTIDTDNSNAVVTTRTRGRKRQQDDETHAFMLDIKKSFTTLKSQQDTIQQRINDIQTQNSDIIKSMDFISQQYEDMKNRLHKLETEKLSHLAYIQTLENKVEILERSQKQASIEIRNIPVLKSETRDNLLDLVKKIGVTTNTPVEESHVRDVFRLNSYKGPSKPIIVDFTTAIYKEKLLSSVKMYNRTNKDRKINTCDLQLHGQPAPIFITECLTQKARKIFYAAREFCKQNDYDFCWTAYGKVFIRKSEGAPSRRIDSEDTLAKLQTQTIL